MDLQVNKNNDKSWIWDCPADYSEDVSKPSADVYAIRFNAADGTSPLLNTLLGPLALHLRFSFLTNRLILLLDGCNSKSTETKAFKEAWTKAQEEMKTLLKK